MVEIRLEGKSTCAVRKRMPLTKAAKIGIAWSIITITSIGGFVLSKRSIEERRVESMKVRDRMRKSNFGEYPSNERKYT
ncbi:uncharacterized protein LOC135934227 [Cloeon dipterum]|uniref:uncharacterized protein LOC135934227 n=1 Tax=Cloeon dipterum TaxID=197152 RepID=UPI00321F6D2F